MRLELISSSLLFFPYFQYEIGTLLPSSSFLTSNMRLELIFLPLLPLLPIWDWNSFHLPSSSSLTSNMRLELISSSFLFFTYFQYEIGTHLIFLPLLPLLPIWDWNSFNLPSSSSLTSNMRLELISSSLLFFTYFQYLLLLKVTML